MDARRIGSEHDGRYLGGTIDEVRIYDRVLTAAEATKIPGSWYTASQFVVESLIISLNS